MEDVVGAALQGMSVVGVVVHRPLVSVRPNPWNPNQMTGRQKDSLKAGLATDGWLASQPLLVWGTDEMGVRKDIIIDGEHRFRAGLELGMTDGPMVYLDGITEAQAKALTVKMNQKRGKWNEDDLGELLRGIQHDLVVDDIALDLGFRDEEFMKLLGSEPVVLPGDPTPASSTVVARPDAGPADGNGTMRAGPVRLVQLFFDDATIEPFKTFVATLSAQYDTKNVTDTVYEAVRRAANPTS